MKKIYFFTAFLFILSFIYILPVFKNFSYLGIHDWCQFYTWNDIARSSILKYRQFPLWAPYISGGNPALAHSHSSFLSPFYLPILIWGAVIGSKLAMFLFILAGIIGMFFLAGYYRLTTAGSFFAACLWTFNGCTSYHFSIGHMDHFPIMLLPLVFLFYLKANEGNKKYIIYTSLVLALTIFSGGIYPFIFCISFLLAYSIISSIQVRNTAYLKHFSYVLLLCLLIGAVKFIPLARFLFEKESIPQVASEPAWRIIFDSFLKRDIGLHSNYVGVLGTWEFGNYTGLIPVILLLAGTFLFFKKDKAIILTGIFFLFASLIEKVPALFNVLNIPLLNGFHIPFRFIVIFLFCMSLISGKVLSYIEKSKLRTGKIIVIATTAIVVIDLISANGRVFNNIFTIPVSEITAIKAGEFQQDEIDWQEGKENPEYSGIQPYALNMYKAYLSNCGTINAYDPLHLTNHAAAITNPAYRGETFLIGNTGKLNLKYFSPQKLVFETHIPGIDRLVINQNYYPGWKVMKNGRQCKMLNHKGLLAVEVDKNDKEIVFYYLPADFLIGLFISLVTVFLFILLVTLKSKEVVMHDQH